MGNLDETIDEDNQTTNPYDFLSKIWEAIGKCYGCPENPLPNGNDAHRWAMLDEQEPGLDG